MTEETEDKVRRCRELAERFPFLQRSAWGTGQTLRAGKLLESFSPDEQTVIGAMLDQPHIPSQKALQILDTLSDMSPAKRNATFEQARSGDDFERGKALEAATNLPPSPDPGFLKLGVAYRELVRAFEACRSEGFKERLQVEVGRLKKLSDEFAKHVAKERKKALR